MKSLNLLALLFLIAGLAMFTSCEDDEFTEEDAKDAYEETLVLEDSLRNLRDSLEHVGGIIDYSVNVIDASNASFSDDDLKLAGMTGSMEGTIVTVSQHGVTLTQTTDASGIATFSDLRIGTVSVNVQAEDFTNASFTALIAPVTDTIVNDYYGILRYSSTLVPVFSLAENLATIEGQVTLETDLTNETPEIGSGIPIVASIDASHPDFEEYLLQICEDCDNANGKITQIAYDQAQASTSTEEDGSFTIQVPGTPGGLPVKIEISEYATDQTLLLRELHGEYIAGPQTIRTYFSSDFTTAGQISSIPYVPGAYVTFSAPNGSISGAPDQQATAVAHIGESGLMSVEISSAGYGYTQAPRLVVDEPANPMGTQAVVDATLTNGQITSVNITEQGSGYVGSPSINIQTIDDGDFGEIAQAHAVVNFEVTDITVNNQGDLYVAAPNVTITSNSGTGATAEAIMGGYVNTVDITNPGSSYVAPPAITANDPELAGGTVATFTANMSDNNPLHSIIVEDNFNTTYETTPDVTITSAVGSGATAVAQLVTAGEIDRIEIAAAGAGYTEAPAVNISGGGGFGASAYATIDGGGSVNAIIIVEGGQGYTSDPTVQISAPPAGGTQATGTAVRAFDLDAIIINNAGNGYNVSYTGTGDNYNNEPTVTIDGVPYTDADNEITVRPAMDVEGVNITNNGYGYTTEPTLTFSSIFGEGSGAAATATMLYRVDDIEILNAGSGYEWNDVDITIDRPADVAGTQALASVTLGNGTISEIVVDNGGQGYTAEPTITLTGGNEDVPAVVNAVVSNGEIIGFNVTSGGEGYDNVVAVNIRTYHTHAILNTSVHQTAGAIENIEVTNPGSGYEIAPVVEFNNNGTGGQGAEAVATIENGRVSGIEITNAGSGYISAPTISLVVPNYLETAVGFPTITEGRITGVEFASESFLTRGMGYEDQPTITFTPQVSGEGSGATAQADISNGEINSVIMLTQGNGYTARNYPESAKPFAVYPSGDGFGNTFNAIANKTYIRDIYLGTGKRNPQAE